MSYTSEELLNAIVSCSSDGFIATDEFGKIVFVNEAIERLTGYGQEELLGKETSSLYLLPESLLSSATDPESPVLPQAAILHRRDGKKITIKARQIRIKDLSKPNNKFKGYLTIFHTESLLGTSTERAQVEFVSTVSHELRTPLTSIRGFAETLLKSGTKLAEENKQKYMSIIMEQADRLIRLVEDLLAVSRLESQNFQLTVRSLDLKKFINKVCDILSSKSSNHKIVQNIENDLPNVWADADKLEQILTNLIDNAIKYSPGGSTVIVTATSVANSNNVKDKLKIEVHDEGIGINKKDQEKIFSKFGRLDNPLTRQAQGTGLGLFITKSLVLTLKGEIYVNSQLGDTTFTVVLPAVVPNFAIPLSSGVDSLKSCEGDGL